MRIPQHARQNAWRSPNQQTTIQEKTDLEINPQSSSLFYNGTIPVEIKDAIFNFALTEYTKDGVDDQYPPDTNYTRPGYTGKRKVSINVLLLCRRTYMETYHLPATRKEHVFWHLRSPPSASGHTHEESYYLRCMEAWQLALVREVHLFTQMYWIEGSLLNLCKKSCMHRLEKMKITFRRGDWWDNEGNAPLRIDPHHGNSNGMSWDMVENAEAEGKWQDTQWGCAFKHLKNLKEIEMEFETSEDKLEELEGIVKRAQAWKIPAADSLVFSSEGLETKTSTWRGTMCYWSDICPYCSNERSCDEVDGELRLEGCKERKLLREAKLGPMLTMTSVRWKLEAAEA